MLHVCACGNAQAMRTMFERDIDVFHFSYGGRLLGLTPAMALDQAEEFRPLPAGSTVLMLVNSKVIGARILAESLIGQRRSMSRW